MKTTENTKVEIDKSSWPSGPWKEEPDRVEWRHNGLPCVIVRGRHHGVLCGYVGIPHGHPLHGLHWSDRAFHLLHEAAHGGVTATEPCGAIDGVCHVPEDGEDPDVWWVGFDCAHVGDFIPTGLGVRDFLPPFYKGEDANDWGDADGVYRDLEYVQGVTCKLADALGLVASIGRRST